MSSSGTRYSQVFFKIKAISQETLKLPPGASKSEVLKAIDGKVLGEAEFFGTYSR
jgi:Phospholipid-binding protein